MNEIINSFAQNLQAGNFSLFLLAAAFLGGVLASLSPCTLGILPVVVGFVAGEREEAGNFSTFLKLLSFVFGLSVVLTAIGVFCAALGKVFMAAGGNLWIIFMASLIAVFGLNLLGVVEIPTFNFVKTMPKSKGMNLFIYPFVLGMMFAFAATPCSTPILASIMGFATLSKKLSYAALLLFLFSLGQGLIIILAGVFTSFVKNIKTFNKISPYLIKFAGVLLLIASFLMFYKVFSPFFIK